jgi:hypothetical protein
MNIPATSDPRSDKEILDAAEKEKGLESGTVRDAQGTPRNMRYFPPAPVETYNQYLARVSGLTDFTPLTEPAWRKETHQLTAEEQILADLGITKLPVVETKHYSDGSSATGVAPLPDLSPGQQDAADGTVEVIRVVEEIDIAKYLNLVPDAVLREMNSKCPVKSKMQGDIGVMATAPAPDVADHAAEAEARHNAAHPPVKESIEVKL